MPPNFRIFMSAISIKTKRLPLLEEGAHLVFMFFIPYDNLPQDILPVVDVVVMVLFVIIVRAVKKRDYFLINKLNLVLFSPLLICGYYHFGTRAIPCNSPLGESCTCTPFFQYIAPSKIEYPAT